MGIFYYLFYIVRQGKESEKSASILCIHLVNATKSQLQDVE